MEYDKRISEMTVGDRIQGFYILKNASAKTTMGGKPYLNAALSDISGEIEAKVWDYSGPIGSSDEGAIVKVEGTVSEFRGSLQFTVDKIRLKDNNDRVNLDALVPVAPIDIDGCFARIEDCIDSMSDPDYAAVCSEMMKRHGEELRRIPAAKSVHHAFLSGLLMHTSDMLAMADFLARQYSAVIDRNLLLAGTLLHDFAKSKEFVFSDLGLVTDYSVAGELLGHLVMGAQEVASIAKDLNIPEEKSMLLQHMILSHHGEPEFGAAVKPMCAESELLSYIDLVDSRMEIYRENLEKTPVGTFSTRIFALDGRIYHHS